MYPAYAAPSQKALALYDTLVDFMRTEVFPAEAAYDAYREQAGAEDHSAPPVVEELKVKGRARSAGPHRRPG